jgi:hypothetical protein
MTNAPFNASNTTATAALMKEIGAKWSKFSAQDLSALKSTDDLVGQVVTKYGLEKVQAQRDVDALMRGRRI